MNTTIFDGQPQLFLIFLFDFNRITYMDQFVSELSESEDEILQPVSKFSPPNDIITKDYPADEKPLLKLIKPTPPEQSCLELKKKYKSLFESEDTLGYHYSLSLANNLIYLKFNNQNYLRLKTKNSSHKFLSGMFIPTEKLLSSETKNSRNVYKALGDIEFVEYKSQNIEESFGKNCKALTLRDLKFSSNYDSANLFIAMKKRQCEYDLIIQNDINSKGNTQWFNFLVEFPQEGVYRINILNFTKSYSQYQDGMRVVYYSYKDHELGLGGWTRGCQSISYEKSAVSREDCDSKKYYTLKFDYTCTHSSDRVIFAYFYPYTGLDLEKFLKRTLYRKINVRMKMEKVKVCETLSGLPIYVISIQHKRNNIPTKGCGFNSNSPQNPNKSVVILARQHPGQTQGSFVAEGVVEFLMENSEIDYLKKGVQFYIFPMVNPDGVLYGNYRTNLAGTDLNRMWRAPRKDIHPEIYNIKKYMQNINKNAPISIIIDLHGHSKSLNSFFYGNPPKKEAFLNQTEDPRLFPYVCSKKIKQVSFTQSTFITHEDKKNSARVVLSEIFPKALVYTFQNSFHGWKKNQSVQAYTPEILKKIGRELILTYLEYERVLEKNPQIREKWIREIQDLKVKETECEDGGSDSEAENDLISISLPLEDSHEKSIFDSQSKVSSFLKYCTSNKENFIQRNRLIRTHDDKRQNRYLRNFITGESIMPQNQTTAKSEAKQKEKEKKLIQAPNQGFLSIVKIQTQTTQDRGSQDLNRVETAPKSLTDGRGEDMRFSKESVIERLKKKRIKIEEAMNSCSGVRSFLHTMGIPIDKKIAS